MADTPPSSDKDKIADILAIIAAKGDEQKTALIELAEQTRESKTLLSDVMAQRTEFAAHVKDLKAVIDTTRRALDPKVLAQHVADNNDAFMGNLTHKFARALDANAERDRDLLDTTRSLKALTAKLSSETTLLSGLAARLEERDARSKWDWVTLATGMVAAAMLAGGGAVYFTKQKLDSANFQDAISLIQNDDDAYWCGSAQASIVQDRDGTHYCAIQMPKYVVPEQAE